MSPQPVESYVEDGELAAILGRSNWPQAGFSYWHAPIYLPSSVATALTEVGVIEPHGEDTMTEFDPPMRLVTWVLAPGRQ